MLVITRSWSVNLTSFKHVTYLFHVSNWQIYNQIQEGEQKHSAVTFLQINFQLPIRHKDSTTALQKLTARPEVTS